ncbi:hypothetical protein DL95DRAFT_468223 [Leptodontidium sp. 2 PMI_412]|nr:hypothetical protein DL95DRAFT_468223 [Leptodontidium sp. 2 PMI_412]
MVSITSAASSNASTYKNFDAFPKLPIELRQDIWIAALPGPRIVHLQAKSLGTPPSYRVWSDPGTVSGRINAIGFISQSIIPLADVCKESRRIVETRFTKVFGTSAVFPTVWFDFKRDTLYFDLEEIKSSRYYYSDYSYGIGELGSDLMKVEYLALYDDFLVKIWNDRDPISTVLDIIQHCGNIKTLTVVDRQYGIVKEDLVMMSDLIYIDASLATFENMIGKNYDREVDERNRHARYKVIGGLDYELPDIIEHKTMTTRKKMEEYEKAEKSYYAKKCLVEYCIKVRSEGLEPVWFCFNLANLFQDTISRRNGNLQR